MSKPRVGSGNITITLNGQDYELIPTLGAAQSISRLSGGLRGAIQSVMNLDLDTIDRIVKAGLGPTVSREIGPNLGAYVFDAGFTDQGGELASKCIEYLTVLSNGGRPLTTTDEAPKDPPKDQN
jgi:hypothetical protein